MAETGISPRIDSCAGVMQPLQAVLDTALDAAVLMDLEGYIVDWNSTAEVIFGWSKKEAVGRLMADLIIPSKYRAKHSAGLARFRETGQGPILRRRIEIMALRRSGAEFPIELSVTPAESLSERFFIGFVRDISERRTAEELLVRQLRHASLLAKISSLAGDTYSLENAFRSTLDAICEVSGWPVGHALITSFVDGEAHHAESTGIWRTPEGENYKRLQEATARIQFTPGEGLPGRVLETGEPVWMSDLDENAGFVRAALAGDLGARSGFAFPVKSDRRVIAILEFFTDQNTPPDKDLMLLVRSIGDQVGRVFERVRANEQLRREKLALEQEVKERKKIEQHQELLLAELNHRVKNMLAVVMGIASQTAKSSPSIEAFSSNFLGRLTSLSNTFTLLTSANWERSSLAELANNLFASHIADEKRISVKGPQIMLEPRIALSISMILHELITNAVKYGALVSPDGQIELNWHREEGFPDDLIVVDWVETGVKLQGPPHERGFGSKLIEATLRHELQGTGTADWREHGLHYRFQFPCRRAGAQQ